MPHSEQCLEKQTEQDEHKIVSFFGLIIFSAVIDLSWVYPISHPIAAATASSPPTRTELDDAGVENGWMDVHSEAAHIQL